MKQYGSGSLGRFLVWPMGGKVQTDGETEESEEVGEGKVLVQCKKLTIPRSSKDSAEGAAV